MLDQEKRSKSKHSAQVAVEMMGQRLLDMEDEPFACRFVQQPRPSAAPFFWRACPLQSTIKEQSASLTMASPKIGLLQPHWTPQMNRGSVFYLLGKRVEYKGLNKIAPGLGVLKSNVTI